jgi:hypothetical protein
MRVLEDEVRELLRELARTTGAVSVAVVHETPQPGPRARMAPLGGGVFLRLELGAPPVALVGEPSAEPPRLKLDPRREAELAEAMERSARALRACARRWEAERVPACSVQRTSVIAPAHERIKARIHAFLRALASTQNAVNAVVTLRRQVVTSSHPMTESQSASIAFTIRRVDVEASRKSSSHAELMGDDFYAVSFWYQACLIVFFSGPYAVDFVRHRARLVTRELAQLLALLDEPPPAAATLAPIPE